MRYFKSISKSFMCHSGYQSFELGRPESRASNLSSLYSSPAFRSRSFKEVQIQNSKELRLLTNREQSKRDVCHIESNLRSSSRKTLLSRRGDKMKVQNRLPKLYRMKLESYRIIILFEKMVEERRNERKEGVSTLGKSPGF